MTARTVTISFQMDEEMFDQLLLIRFLDGHTIEATTQLALKTFLDARADTPDFKMALSLKKQRGIERARLKELDEGPRDDDGWDRAR